MVSLSAERINTTAPYKVSPMRDGHSVIFKTDFGIEYIVGFDPSDVLLCAETYQFFITNVNNKKSPRDDKLKETVIAIAWDFLMSSNDAMVYICETGDGRQSLRNRLFQFWIAESPLYNKVMTMTTNLVDEEGIENYATLVIRKEHTKGRQIIDEFLAVAEILGNKPNR